MNTRETRPLDIPALQHIVEESGLFPGDMLPGMFESAQTEGPEQVVWLTCEQNGKPVAFCFAEKEALTQSTWNMRAIAVHPAVQRTGAGRALLKTLEARLLKHEQSLLIVDTSGTDTFAFARAFYKSCGYELEARIRDFWSPGDDKIIFRKALG